MTAVLEAIRRVVAEDAAHSGTTHEVYLTLETIEALKEAASPYLIRDPRRVAPSILGLPLRPLKDSTRRDCIATIRGGQVISVTNL